MQELHTADRQVLALLRVPHRTLRSTRIIRIARMLLCMPFDMVLDMALDIATGVVMVRDIAVGPEAYTFPAAYRNSCAELRSPSSCGFSRWNIIFPSQDDLKESM